MDLETRQLGNSFGTELIGLDLTDDLNGIDFRKLRRALAEYSLILIRKQNLQPSNLAKILRKFGPLRRFELLQARSQSHAERYLCDDEPDIMRIGNLTKDGRPIAETTHEAPDWHIDYLIKTQPNEGSALYSVTAPQSGGDTLFIDLKAAYDSLGDRIKVKIDELNSVYSVKLLDALQREVDHDKPPLTHETLAANPDALHPLVRQHPTTGRKNILFDVQTISQFDGMSVEASRELLSELNGHVLDTQFQYRHKWSVGDLLIWENLSLMHSATTFDAEAEKRLLYRGLISKLL